jgi:hypothetical protein
VHGCEEALGVEKVQLRAKEQYLSYVSVCVCVCVCVSVCVCVRERERERNRDMPNTKHRVNELHVLPSSHLLESTSTGPRAGGLKEEEDIKMDTCISRPGKGSARSEPLRASFQLCHSLIRHSEQNYVIKSITRHCH